MKLSTVLAFVIVCCGVLAALGCGNILSVRPAALSVEAPQAEVPLTPFLADPLASASAEDVLIAAAKARPAPELTKGEWINSDALTLAGLKGNVVYIEFWTFAVTTASTRCRRSRVTTKSFAVEA